MKRSVVVVANLLRSLAAILLLAAPVARAQIAGYALDFDGANDFVSVPLIAPPATNYTLSAWVFLRAGGTYGGIRMAVLSSTVPGDSIEFLIRSATENPTDPQYLELGRFNFFDGSPSTTPVPTNAWTHVAVTVSSNKSVSYFINGSPAGTWSAAGMNVSLATNVNLGDNSGSRRFSGRLDEVQIWDRVLSPAEILSDWNRTRSGGESGLYAYYHCDEGAGTNTADSAAAGGVANGTLQNGTTWVASTAPISSLFVTTTADSGGGSLRTVLAAAANNSTITFAPNLSGQTITLTTGELLISQNLTIVGPGATNLAVSGNNASRVFNINNGFTLNLAGLTVRNGRTPVGTNSGAAGSPGGNALPGGGIFNAGTLNLTNCTLTANATGGGGNGWPPVNPASGTAATSGGAGGAGGGIYNQGTLRLFGCTVNGNSSGNGGFGGFGNWSTNTGGLGGRGGDGGGIFNANGASLTLQSCTVAANSAGSGGGGGNAAQGANGNPGANGGSGGTGGGGGGIGSAGTTTLTACTISGNSAANGGSGGFAAPGFGGGGSGSAGGGGGVLNSVATPVACNNTIIALNSAGTASDVSGAFNSAGYNFIGRIDGSTGLGAATDRFGTVAVPANPLLGALANNGGGTLTLALLSASPALDAGNDALAATLITDQRGAGFARLRGAHVDIGAYELDLPGFSAPTIVTQTAGSITINPITHLGSLTISATVNPNSFVATAWLQFGLTPSYGNSTAPVSLGSGAVNIIAPLPLTGLAPGLTWHYRVAAASAVGTNYGPNQTVSISVPGDVNGDGVVSQTELDAVYGNYVTNSPWLYMTNVAGLGGTNVTFALSNSTAGAYSVQYTTNLLDWLPLGPATPRYGFTDTNAPALPHRYYRLVYP